MYQFLQFDVNNKKEPWRKFTIDQVSTLSKPPAFLTVLAVDQDPEEVIENDLDPLEHVKYFGPMYFDLDDEEDIDHVLEDARALLVYLTEKLDIREELINCWLSGGKGVHMTIAPQVFGITTATKYLPLIYREIMLAVEQGAGLSKPTSTVDHSVYSTKRGRMWRCEGIARPGKGTFKVFTTPAELQEMDSDQYQVLVSASRPSMRPAEMDKSLVFPKAKKLTAAARVAATKRVRAMNESTVVPKEALQAWEGIPGCIQTLITEGDCDGSNWNQAAMQLATYIAARYERSDEAEYTADLVNPFCENVESSSRASVSLRSAHMKGQLNRAFSGSIKFSPGGVIACIGSPCRNCPICRHDLATGESDQAPQGELRYDETMKIGWNHTGYFQVGENNSRQLTGFTFWPHTEVFQLLMTQLPDGSVSWGRGPRQELLGWGIDSNGLKFGDNPQEPHIVPERAWGSKRDLISAFRGNGDATVYCGDADTQRLLKSIMTFARSKAEDGGLEVMVRSNVCGIILDRKNGKIIPNYIEREGSVMSTGMRSEYRYSSDAPSPRLLQGSGPLENDDELKLAIQGICGMNDPVQVALALGWCVAAHFREHIQFEEPQFPLLNISGNSEAGKTSMAMLICMINGIDYSKSDYQNAEVSTLYPLIKFVTSSTTVPRLVEEVNPSLLGPGVYSKVAGLLKASWNKAPASRGKIGADREVGVTQDRVCAPIVYTSEQSATLPSLRNRSVEVMLQSRALLNQRYKDSYRQAINNKSALFRIAKALVTVAMNTSPKALLAIFHAKDELIHSNITERPRWGHKCCLTGLHMLLHTMKEFKVGGTEDVQRLYDALTAYLRGSVVIAERGRAVSEVDRVLNALNSMADPSMEDTRKLKAGVHYERRGDSLYLVLQSCLPKYMGYMRSIGENPTIRDFSQLSKLLEGEVYFERREPHSERQDVDMYVISLERLARKGTRLNNFEDNC